MELKLINLELINLNWNRPNGIDPMSGYSMQNITWALQYYCDTSSVRIPDRTDDDSTVEDAHDMIFNNNNNMKSFTVGVCVYACFIYSEH